MALATLMPGSGDPYCSLVNVATAADGAPLLLISRLAVHFHPVLLADVRQSDLAGPVHHDAHGAGLVVLDQQHHAAGKIGVVHLGDGDEDAGREVAHIR